MSTAAPESRPDNALVSRHDDNAIATLTLNQPAQYNVLSEAMLHALQGQLDRIADDDNVHAVILAGAGRAFCAGHDLKEMRARPDRDYYRSLFAKCSRLMLSITQLPQPVIARVHGITTAAGCQLVAACDLAVASNSARFAVSGINVGLFCTTPGVALGRNVARKHAMEMLLTGEFVDAEQAVRYGLINRAVPDDALDDTVTDLAMRIAAKSPAAIRIGKRAFYRQIEKNLAEAYDEACEVMAGNMMAEDAGEGIDAFIEKRPPTWRGR